MQKKKYLLKFKEMEKILQILPTIQIILAVFLIIFILLQQTGVGMGTGLGGEDGSLNTKRRGLEKSLLTLTTFTAIIFVLSILLNFWLQS